MAFLLIIVFGAVLLWLKMYTNHGQKLELKDYTGIHYKKAAKDASKRSFELIVKDSLHKVGQPGGLIISQNPSGGALVKENRKIYVDITKYNADEIALESLPTMYGREFTSVTTTLDRIGIKTKEIGKEYDSGTPNHILQVRYEGKIIAGKNGRKKGIKIKKGGTLEFIVSKREGGQVNIPDLVCTEYGGLGFVLDVYNLEIGALEKKGAITNMATATIISQSPTYAEGKMISMGDKIEIVVQQEKPESCED